jgi:hypothetical protein
MHGYHMCFVLIIRVRVTFFVCLPALLLLKMENAYK